MFPEETGRLRPRGIEPTTVQFKSTRLRRVLLVPTSFLFALLVLEFAGFFKVLNFSVLIGPKAVDRFAATNRGDPELLHIHPPHSHFLGESRGGNITSGYRIPDSDMLLYRWDARYDRNGFRNDVDLDKAGLVVIGDSFVEEITIPTPELMTSILSTLQGVSVANLGQYGYGPLEEFAVLRRYGLPLRPRVVIWMFFEGNDLKDVLHFRSLTALQGTRPGLGSPLLERSFTYNVLAQIHFQCKRISKPSGIKRAGILAVPTGEEKTMYFVYSSPPFSSDDLIALQQTLDTIAASEKLCAPQGVRLLFVFIPTKFRVLHDFCKFPKESECRNWTLNDLAERLQKGIGAMSPGVEYLDLTPYLVKAVSRGELPYYPDDDHWSPEGQKLAAQIISDYLASGHQKVLASP